ncbi:unnamed protein product, partial [Lepeophtheirus salmonis]
MDKNNIFFQDDKYIYKSKKTQDFLKYDFTSNERNIELDLYEQLPIEKIPSDKNYPIQTVEQVMLSEDNACNVHESILEPGWAKNIENDWLVVINTHKYHQKIKITHCYHLSTNVSCTKTDSGSCLQEYTRKKLLVIDPNNLEKGIYFSEFDVPENCTCPSKKKNMTDLFIQSGKDVLIEEGIKKNNVRNYLKNFSQRYISTKPSMLNHTVLSTPMT